MTEICALLLSLRGSNCHWCLLQRYRCQCFPISPSISFSPPRRHRCCRRHVFWLGVSTGSRLPAGLIVWPKARGQRYEGCRTCARLNLNEGQGPISMGTLRGSRDMGQTRMVVQALLRRLHGKASTLMPGKLLVQEAKGTRQQQ